MANLSHAHVSASASFSIWAYWLFVSKRKRDAYATGFQPPACFCWKAIPSPHAEAIVDTLDSQKLHGQLSHERPKGYGCLSERCAYLGDHDIRIAMKTKWPPQGVYYGLWNSALRQSYFCLSCSYSSYCYSCQKGPFRQRSVTAL